MNTAFIIILAILLAAVIFLTQYIYRLFYAVGKSIVPNKNPYYSPKFLTIMKQLGSFLKLFIVTLLGFLFPELADPGTVYEWTSTIAGNGLLVALIVQGLKVLFGYDPELSWKHLPKLFAILTGILTSVVFFYLDFGIYTMFESFLQAAVAGILIGGIAIGWWAAPFVKDWLLTLFNVSVPEKGAA